MANVIKEFLYNEKQQRRVVAGLVWCILFTIISAGVYGLYLVLAPYDVMQIILTILYGIGCIMALALAFILLYVLLWAVGRIMEFLVSNIPSFLSTKYLKRCLVKKHKEICDKLKKYDLYYEDRKCVYERILRFSVKGDYTIYFHTIDDDAMHYTGLKEIEWRLKNDDAK